MKAFMVIVAVCLGLITVTAEANGGHRGHHSDHGFNLNVTPYGTDLRIGRMHIYAPAQPVVVYQEYAPVYTPTYAPEPRYYAPQPARYAVCGNKAFYVRDGYGGVHIIQRYTCD